MDKLSFPQYINIGHMLIIAPLIIYVSYMSIQGKKINDYFFYALILLGIFAFIYHSYRLYEKLSRN